MNQLWPKRGFVALCVLLGLLVTGVGAVAADELFDEHDTDGEECDLLYADAYAEIDTLAERLPVDHVLEADVLGPIQAVVSQLDYDVKTRGCAVESA
ncbi:MULTISPECIES: hypothetical protein [Haloferax]|uniref:Uncharacterized protein n=1 Tax=Haloferax marinum TaxID=2666143 RepID=A0A6A8G8R0_9EURY|nr:MULTISPECIES: hypothetical protein [Haloferax]KAB1198446.1 hypothetical protein Hfx1150_13345 [Haloferax sp. CBA1150]MRW97549.1 hypothetical protein [Haloferax marinum]